MDSNIKDGSNYLDGVPMKISPKFWPPKPVTLPLALDTSSSADLLSETYDFSLERNVIEHNRRRQLELEAAKVKTVQKDSSGASNDPREEAAAEASSSSVQQCVLPLHSDIILQPKPPLDKTSDSSHAAKGNDTKINLSDFENDTSSPFDLMELQTINDLEELSSVFQDIHNKTSTEDDSKDLEKEEKGDDRTGNVAKSVSFPLPQNSWHVSSEKIPSSASEDFKSAPFSDYVGPCHSAGGVSCDNSTYSTLSQVPYLFSSSGAHGTQHKTVSLRGSKSYSDICSLSGTEVLSTTRGRSSTPPTLYSEIEDEAYPALRLNEDHFARPLTETSNGVSDSENNAYEELDEAAKQFADCITEMGFARGQVARAVKHLGIDEKKVVEHLCQIQALEESGYESSEAEAALHLHDYNRDQAKAFLDLVNQFQDLGFEKDAIKKALVQNKNDWNKTIDALLP